eukprot:scaffold170805_cov18-Tisochrysis_lutea.AAC.1
MPSHGLDQEVSCFQQHPRRHKAPVSTRSAGNGNVWSYDDGSALCQKCADFLAQPIKRNEKKNH